MFWHIDTDIIALLVMCALYIYTARMLPEDGHMARNGRFLWCLRVGVVTTAFDIASSVVMDVPSTRFWYHALMTAYMLTQTLVILSWIMYALTILYEDDAKKRGRVAKACWAVYVVFAVFVVSNPWTKLFYSLGANMEYARGPLFLPGLAGLNYGYAAVLLALIFVRRRHIPLGYPKAVLVMQPVILSAATVVQLLMPGWLLIYPAYMICLVLAFLFFQSVRVRDERAQSMQQRRIMERFACGMSICGIGEDGTFDVQYISGGMAAIYETDAESIRRGFHEDILTGIHPDDKEMVESRLRDMARDRGAQEMTYRLITGTGKQKWVHVHAETEISESGEPVVYATYTDLTNLKRAEEIIDVALKNTGVSIWEYEFDKRRIIQYQNSTEMHGFAQIVPDVPHSLVENGFVHPDSAEAFYAMYDKLFSGAPFAEGVFKVRTSDRKGYWYEHIRYTNSFDENGRPRRAVGMSTDETQRQEAIEKYERELEKERAMMAEENLLAHATFDLTTGETLDYRMQDGAEVPEAQRTAFAYGSANAGLLIDETERARFLALNDRDALLARFAAGESDFRLDYRRTLLGGRVIWVRNTLRLLRDPRGGHILMFECWYDVEAEKMLEAMYQSIASDNYDFVARIDGKTGRFDALFGNETSFHMPPRRGDDADAVTRALYDECVAPEDRAAAIDNCLLANMRARLKENGRNVFTYRATYPDGCVRFKIITQYFIDAQREVIAFLREDVTDLIRQEAEKNRVLSEALEAANQASRAKSQFLSRVSHELRTPLNAIIGFMELAKDADAKQTAIYLANSNAAARQLLSIINDVLDMSSIESGKLKIAHAPFDMKRLVKGLTDMYVSQCGQKGLEYETMLLTPIDEWLIGDPLRVNQILLNLLNNALKFTSRGRVWLKISQRPVRGDRLIVRFEVSDTGCGMSEEMRGRLFRPFEQESAVTAQKYGGNGLGLSIVGSLVGMMGGVIDVKSRPGEGSDFTVDLPFAKCETETGAGTLEGAEHIHVLAVDDTDTDRAYISAVLERMRVRHACAEDGLAALKELSRAKDAGDAYNVCLVDWKMPDINGLETTRRIRREYGAGLMVIVVSAYDHYQADETVKAAGANMFISKPLFQSSLFDLFVTLTSGRVTRWQEDAEEYDLHGMRVLLAEDNAMNRMMMENMLRVRFGARCDCAQDGRIAVDMFLAAPQGAYDAILMDIQMPNMDGYEATRRIRASEHPDASTIQIIAVTANAFSEDVTKSLFCGMNAHVSKPIEPNMLGAALARAFKGRRQGIPESGRGEGNI